MMTRTERLTAIENEVVDYVGEATELQRLVTYKYLFNLGYRISGIDALIHHALTRVMQADETDA
jgi:hypothetical protein